MQKFILPMLFLSASLIYGCSQKSSESRDVGKFEGHPRNVEIKYAKGVEIERLDDGLMIKLLSPFRDIHDTLIYQVGGTKKNGSSNTIHFENPVDKVVLMTSTYSGFLDELDKIEIVKAISNKSYFYNQKILESMDQNEIQQIGYVQNLNYEEILMVDPQVIIFSGMSSADLTHYSKLVESGIKLLPIAEWQEENPLGRAEWIKVFGAFTGTLDRAIQIFDSIESRYNKLVLNPDDLDNKPSVIVNAPYKDIWWLPGGKSYMSYLLKDAGADYLWKNDSSTGGIQADLEVVFFRAHDADYWINPSTAKSMNQLINMDERYKEFKSVNSGHVYNNTLKISESGGNAYFERGVVNPDLILADLIKIFHPNQLKDHNFYFYEKLN